MGEMKKKETIDETNDLMVKFLEALKHELIETFGNKGQFEYETEWVYASGTFGWQEAIKTASCTELPQIYRLWDALDWRDSEGLDNWIIDCALNHDIIKPISEDPEFQ